MPVSKKEKEFVAYVVDLMSSIGPVQAKGMFGGHGIFLEGLMFALVADSELYLKGDKETEDEFREKMVEAGIPVENMPDAPPEEAEPEQDTSTGEAQEESAPVAEDAPEPEAQAEEEKTPTPPAAEPQVESTEETQESAGEPEAGPSESDAETTEKEKKE